MIIPMMAFYLKNFKKHIKCEFVKIRKYKQVIIFVIFSKKDNFGNFDT